jgi:hypothetical protein
MSIYQTEKATIGFKTLRNIEHDFARDLALRDDGQAAKNILVTVQALNNSEDLSNLLEVNDVVEELHILQKLFGQQVAVINKMIQVYEKVDVQNGDKDAHARARLWLSDAESKVKGYIKKAKVLIDHCKETTTMVSCPSYKS